MPIKLDTIVRKRPRISDQIYDRLLDRVRQGKLAPGERLVDATLAADMGVSRMPVREALKRLADEGYLTGTSRGFALAEISAHDAREIFEMRRLLEPRAVASAVLHVPAEGLAALDAIHDDAQQAIADDDTAQFIQALRRFRNLWLEHVPNRRLAETVHRTIAQIDGIQRVSFADPAARLIVAHALTRLLAAFRAGDPLAAQDIVANLIERGQDIFLGIRAA